MTRDFLKNLGITDADTISQILNEAGQDIGREKAKTEQVQNDLNNATQQLADRAKDIEALQKSATDSGELTKQLNELQEKYNTDTANFQKQIAERDYSAAVDRMIENIPFSSQSAKKAFKADLIASGKELKDGKIEGFDEFLESQKKSDPDAFRQENKPTVFTKGKTSEVPPTEENEGARYAKEYASRFIKSNKE